MTTKKKHVHQYHRTFPYGRGTILGRVREQWECALPDCSHFLPGNMLAPIGKLSLCHECMNPFVLDAENMKQDKPVCVGCVIEAPEINVERLQIKSTIATKTGRPFSEITEEEIDRVANMLSLNPEEEE